MSAWVNTAAERCEGSAFASTTTVHKTAPRTYTARIDERWNLQPLPQGGVTTAVAVRAMCDDLAHPSQPVRMVHTVFASRVRHGDVRVDIESLRRGRSMSQMRAEVRNADAHRGHVVTCAFGANRRGFDFTAIAPPTHAPRPEDCISLRDGPDLDNARAVMPFWSELVEARLVTGHPPWQDSDGGSAERVLWYRFDEPPLAPDGELDPLALIILADTMPGAVRERVGTEGRSWFAPSVDLNVQLLDRWTSEWVLAHNRARYASDGYASVEMMLWDCGTSTRAAPRLVAYATQLFLFTFPDDSVLS